MCIAFAFQTQQISVPRAEELSCEQQRLVKKSRENNLSQMEILNVLRYCDNF